MKHIIIIPQSFSLFSYFFPIKIVDVWVPDGSGNDALVLKTYWMHLYDTKCLANTSWVN